MISEEIKKTYINKFRSLGNDRFYKFLIAQAVKKLSKEENYSPELEYLNLHEQFLFLYRREKNEEMFKLSKLFRKAAHKIYRLMIKMGLIDKNLKFLNIMDK